MNKFNLFTISDIDNFSNSSLKLKEDLSLLLDECNRNDEFNKFEDLCFTGKYVNGLLKVLKTGSSNPEVKSLDHIKKDLSDNMEKVISQLKEITLNSSEEIKELFNKKYFTLSAETFSNLTVLVSDLDTVKQYFNHLKRK